MPVRIAVHDGLDGDFQLLDFDEMRSIGYGEYPTGAVYVQDRDEVSAYALSAERLREAALPPDASHEWVASRVLKHGQCRGGRAMSVDQLTWRKSRRSSNRENCAELGFGPEVWAVRDAKDCRGGVLRFGPRAWLGFLSALEDGRLTRDP